MTKLTGRSTDVESIELSPGETAQLPNGLGSVTFDDESPEGATDPSESVKRFASLQIHRDESGVFVLGFALLALGGLMLALFVPRRRVWVKATATDGAVDLEYAALAEGKTPRWPAPWTTSVPGTPGCSTPRAARPPVPLKTPTRMPRTPPRTLRPRHPESRLTPCSSSP